MKTITIEVPEGKNAKWVNGVLTLVDEQDNSPVTERNCEIKDITAGINTLRSVNYTIY